MLQSIRGQITVYPFRLSAQNRRTMCFLIFRLTALSIRHTPLHAAVKLAEMRTRFAKQRACEKT